MTIADQMVGMVGLLDIYAQEEGGHAVICGDLVHLWNLLFNNQQVFKILIMYNGEQSRDTFPGGAIEGRVDRHFLCVVSRGRSMVVNNRAAPLAGDFQNARPLFTIAEEVRDMCRGFLFDPAWTERPVDYKGIRPFNSGAPDLIVDALEINFSVGTQLGMIQSISDDQTVPS